MTHDTKNVLKEAEEILEKISGKRKYVFKELNLYDLKSNNNKVKENDTHREHSTGKN